MPLSEEGESMMAAGWVPYAPLQDDLPLMHHDFIFGDHLVITYREDELKYPKDYLRARIAERARQFEEETGEKPPKPCSKLLRQAFEVNCVASCSRNPTGGCGLGFHHP